MSGNEAQSSVSAHIGVARTSGEEQGTQESSGTPHLTGTATADTASQQSRRGGGVDDVRARIEQLCHEYLAGNSTRAEAVLEGSIRIESGEFDAKAKQHLHKYLLDITDKGKGVDTLGTRNENRVRGSFLERLFESGSREGSIGREAGRDEREGGFVDPKGGESREGGERGEKRIREEDLPWYTSIQSAKSRLTEDMHKTRNLLAKYREDVEWVVQSIQAAPEGPVNFPTAEWKNILRGKPVNLNAVFGSLHTFKPVSESLGRLGPFEIRSEVGEPSKRIETAAQWISAWDETVQATETAFPHRAGELREYGRGIRRLFDSIAIVYHKESSSMMKRSEAALEGGRVYRSPTTARSGISTQHIYYPLGQKSKHQGKERTEESKFVEASMGKGVPSEIARTSTVAPSVATRTMEGWSVLSESQEAIVKPRFLRFNCWDIGGRPMPRVLTWSLTAEPLPHAPSLLSNHCISILLKNRPDLFKVVTPINVSVFRSYLKDHPNKAFCISVCRGLEEGFWPWANIDLEGYPEIHDERRDPPHEVEKLTFIRNQRDIEVEKGRFSRSFGKELLKGMYGVPTFAVPKEGSSKLRLVTDQSAGKFSVNSMQTEHTFAFPMDNMTQLGELILRAHNRLGPDQRLILFKSDVAEAYRLIPMHPIWQTKQINTVDGKRYVDRNNVFGGKRSGDTFIAFMSLVLWIAEKAWNIAGLCSYVDDVFGVVDDSQWRVYEPYGEKLPENQTRLLECWDALGVPHKKEKQLYGSQLTIIGFHIDADRLTLSLAPKRRRELLQQLDRFIIRKGIQPQQKKFPLKEFQQLAGWLSWSFNIYPYLRPCLCHLYHKIGSLNRREALVYMNRTISRELEWAERHIQRSESIIFLKEWQWKLGDADYKVICDASGFGLGFWYPELDEGYLADVPPNIPPNIFFTEGLCIASALGNVAEKAKNCKVAIYTDNEASFQVFSSFHSIPSYNPILIYAADVMMRCNLQVRVVWTPGKKNQVADALSRHDCDRAVSYAPNLRIDSFTPPYDAWAPSAQPRDLFALGS